MVGEIQKADAKHQQIEKVIYDWALRCAKMEIMSNVNLTPEQISLLKKLHTQAINFALTMPEGQRDPRKISYMANDELKTGLTAILLTRALVNNQSKAKYTKEYLYRNIVVWAEDDGSAKHVNFNGMEHSLVQEAIFSEIAYDWMLYRSPDGRGINALSDEKTNFQGLSNFKRGFSPISEFSRFERKLHENKQHKLQNQKEETQQSFRNAFAQQIAVAVAKQMLETNDPNKIAKQLFASEDYSQAIENLLSNQKISGSIENKNAKDLPDYSNSSTLSLARPQKEAEEMSISDVLNEIRSLENSHER